MLVLERVAKQRGHSAFKYVILWIIFLLILIELMSEGRDTVQFSVVH